MDLDRGLVLMLAKASVVGPLGATYFRETHLLNVLIGTLLALDLFEKLATTAHLPDQHQSPAEIPAKSGWVRPTILPVSLFWDTR
jgi:hypothetical protein